ncbi:glycosyl hydrolase family 18 protein [Alkalihalobacillus deserti]|uniref:glycosyl hydrolase family 18 protein n=1 Tax=Alkalihalobacillus deserti TaxID=2879466 RepID=UPI001D158C6A|nr:glycosyl hydrolase family 18 protein [Alkalihalobacillus deserti]
MKAQKVSLFAIMIIVIFLFSGKSLADVEKFNMSYLFFGSPSTYVKQVDDTKGSLHVVSPNYFDLNLDGQLEITWRLQTSFIDEMHKRGVRVVPFLANHWNRMAGINGLENREMLAQDVAAAIQKYNLDGVNVDIEGIGHTYRDQHTDFIRLLRQYIPNDKEVSVAVAANPNGWQTGWHGFYDYKGLSGYADYLMIMAYDESWESPDSPVGPVSSLSFFERSIQYALNQAVPNNKVVNGLPFYGRMWKLDGPTLEGVNLYGRGISNRQVSPLAKQFNGQFLYDEQSQTPYVTFTIPKGQSTFVGATKLTEGDYVIWYENEKSIKAKLHAPRKFDIKGTGSWALLHETPDTWDYYKQWLNGDNIDELYPPFEIYSGFWDVNHRHPIARLHIRQSVPLMKKEANGSYTEAWMLRRDEFYRTYGVEGHYYHVGGGYFVKHEYDKMKLLIGRLSIRNETTLYRPDGQAHRKIKTNELIRVYNFDQGKFEVGGGYYIKNDHNVLFFVGFVTTLQDTPLYTPQGMEYRKLKKGETYRVYSIDGNKFEVGGGYYILDDRKKVNYMKN